MILRQVRPDLALLALLILGGCSTGWTSFDLVEHAEDPRVVESVITKDGRVTRFDYPRGEPEDSSRYARISGVAVRGYVEKESVSIPLEEIQRIQFHGENQVPAMYLTLLVVGAVVMLVYAWNELNY